jgi:hypothetical protein
VRQLGGSLIYVCAQGRRPNNLASGNPDKCNTISISALPSNVSLSAVALICSSEGRWIEGHSNVQSRSMGAEVAHQKEPQARQPVTFLGPSLAVVLQISR